MRGKSYLYLEASAVLGHSEQCRRTKGSCLYRSSRILGAPDRPRCSENLDSLPTRMYRRLRQTMIDTVTGAVDSNAHLVASLKQSSRTIQSTNNTMNSFPHMIKKIRHIRQGGPGTPGAEGMIFHVLGTWIPKWKNGVM